MLLNNLTDVCNCLLSRIRDNTPTELAIDFLNLVVGSTRPNFTQSYWGDVLLQEIATKFPRILRESDRDVLQSSCMEKHGVQLVTRLTDVCGIKLTKQVRGYFYFIVYLL